MMSTNRISKIKLLIWPLMYLIILVVTVVSCFNIFNHNFYTSIFVQGPSMQPTLNVNYPSTDRRDFGLVDTSKRAIDKLKRFDIVITYFPWTDYESSGSYQTGDKLKDDADYKIKRLIALPGEKVEIKMDLSIHITTKEGETMIFDCDKDSEVETENYRLPFNRKTVAGGSISQRAKTWTVEENRYFLMGDNWDVSEDCSKHVPVYYENLVGRLVCIEGTCRLDSKGNIVDRRYSLPIPF